MSSIHKVLIYQGSARKDNYSQHVANFVSKVSNERPDIEAEIVTPQSVSISFDDEGQGARPEALEKLAESADAFILIVPEYNHGYSASLKYLLDLNLKKYIHKPVAMVGVSSGPWGGVRALENLVPVLRELGLVTTFGDVNVTNVKDTFTSDGVKDEDKWRERVGKMLKELLWMSETLGYGRENISS